MQDGRLRIIAIIKAYICIFVCVAIKAVHLELVSDRTSTAFISTLTRFLSQRGICKIMHSDNATSFVGTINELKRVVDILSNYPKESFDFLSKIHIQCKFTPSK